MSSQEELKVLLTKTRGDLDKAETCRLQGNTIGAIMRFTIALEDLDKVIEEDADGEHGKSAQALKSWCHSHRGAAWASKGDVDNALENFRQITRNSEGSIGSWALTQAGEAHFWCAHNTQFFSEDSEEWGPHHCNFLTTVSKAWNAYNAALKEQPTNQYANAHCGALVAMTIAFVALHHDSIADRTGPCADKVTDCEDFNNPIYPEWLVKLLSTDGPKSSPHLYFTEHGLLTPIKPKPDVTYVDIDISSPEDLSTQHLADTAVIANEYLLKAQGDKTSPYTWAMLWQGVVLTTLSAKGKGNRAAVKNLIGNGLINGGVDRRQVLSSLLLISSYVYHQECGDNPNELPQSEIDILNMSESLLKINPEDVIGNYGLGKYMKAKLGSLRGQGRDDIVDKMQSCVDASVKALKSNLVQTSSLLKDLMYDETRGNKDYEDFVDNHKGQCNLEAKFILKAISK